MVGFKARSTLVPAEEWIKEFIPYGTTPQCEDAEGNQVDCIEKLEGELAALKADLAALKVSRATKPTKPQPEPEPLQASLDLGAKSGTAD